MVIKKFNRSESAQKIHAKIGIDVKFMYTDFGGRDLSGFGDTATLKNGQISLSTHGHIVHDVSSKFQKRSQWTIVHGHQKI